MKEGQRRKLRSSGAILTVGLCCLAVLLAGSAIILLNNYTSEQLYQESVHQLEELTAQLFEKLDVQIDIQWGYLEKLESSFCGTESVTREDLVSLISHLENELVPVNQKMYFRVITDDGCYYSDEGRQGLWTGLDNISGAEKQSFLLSNWLENETYMAFVLRVDEDITVDGHRIEYLVLLRTMSDMQPFFHSTAFSGHNVAYIINYDGFVLSASGSLSGIDFVGKNVYHRMEDQIYPHMESFSAVLEKGNPSGTVCTDVIIGGERYYLVYDRLPSYDWAVLLLMSAGDVASSASEMVSSLLKVFILVIFFLALLFVVLFLFLSRVKNSRRIIALQEEANMKLSEAQMQTETALEEARKATKAKSQFLANMSHDIRTPMNAIMGVMSLMEHEVENPDAIRYYTKKLRQSGTYMLGLINDVLDMSKIESGDVSLNPGSVRLAEQVGQIESIIRSQCNEKGQEFTVSVREISHEYLIGDSIRLRQIFLNLLTNAVKYTPPGGNISFEIEERPCLLPDHASFFISVIDNGHGMSPEFLKHIFEPFTREVSSVTNKIQGTGLGMSITKSLVDLMNGSITVESEPEKGSRFDVTLTLPVDTAAVYDCGADSVILISDEKILVENVKAAMEKSSVELRVASSSDDAVSLLGEKTADAVILSGDIEMERLAFCVRTLRNAAPHATLIYCTSYSHRENARRAFAKSGLDGLIARPFFFENFAIAIHSSRGNESSHVNEKERSSLSGKRFLCAEDNVLNAEILEALLSMHNASCTICPNGEEIVKAFLSVKDGDYDAVLMDVQMPIMNGLEATRAIRESENPLGRTIPIIAMTANAFSSDVEECYKAGMDAHLAKPIDMTALERTIQSIFSKNTGGGSPLRSEKVYVKQH